MARLCARLKFASRSQIFGCKRALARLAKSKHSSSTSTREVQYKKQCPDQIFNPILQITGYFLETRRNKPFFWKFILLSFDPFIIRERERKREREREREGGGGERKRELNLMKVQGELIEMN